MKSTVIVLLLIIVVLIGTVVYLQWQVLELKKAEMPTGKKSIDIQKPIDKDSVEWAEHVVVERLKEAMHDPYSFELVSIRLLKDAEAVYYTKLESEDLKNILVLQELADNILDVRTFEITYRGKNAYGALRLSTTMAAHTKSKLADFDLVHFFKFKEDE